MVILPGRDNIRPSPTSHVSPCGFDNCLACLRGRPYSGSYHVVQTDYWRERNISNHSTGCAVQGCC